MGKKKLNDQQKGILVQQRFFNSLLNIFLWSIAMVVGGGGIAMLLTLASAIAGIIVGAIVGIIYIIGTIYILADGKSHFFDENYYIEGEEEEDEKKENSGEGRELRRRTIKGRTIEDMTKEIWEKEEKKEII